MADFFVEIEKDAENKRIRIRVTDDSGDEALTGSAPTYGSIELGLADIAGLTVKMREMQACDQDTGTTKYCMVLASELYDTSREV